MNHRDRALAAMRGQAIDVIPFIARMDLWYGYHHNRGTLPHPYEKASLWDMQRDLGIGIFGFGAWDISFYRLAQDGIDISKAQSAGLTVTRYQTPYGTLTSRDVIAEELKEAAGTGARVEFPFKDERDYDALQYLIETNKVVENFDAYGSFVESIGGDGLALPFSGHLPAHQLMLNFMGYSAFYCEMADNAARVERLIAALTEQQRQILALAARCPAPAIEVGGNYDESMTPPPVFDRLFAPFYRDARTVLYAANKALVIHGDGEMKLLRERLMACGVQVVEALTPRPMTSIDISETRRIWGERVCLWGGLASIILTESFSDAECQAFMDDLFAAVAPGARFILGFGDNVPTDARWSRIQQVVRYWLEHGSYPLAQRHV